MYPSEENWVLFLYDLLGAECLLAQDSVDQSIITFEKGTRLHVEWPPYFALDGKHITYDKDVLARARLKKGDIDKAILEYERLTDPDPNKRGRCLIRPTWHYELAKLYEQKGDRSKAIREYEKFLNIWENADADRPELIDAKKRLAVLNAR